MDKEKKGINLYEFIRMNQQTFDDFVKDYLENLKNYLNEFVDNSEIMFIKIERRLWKNHISEFSDFVKAMDDNTNPEQAKIIIKSFRNRLNTFERYSAFLDKRETAYDHDSVLNSENKLTATETACFAYFMDKAKTKYLKNRFPSEKAYEELSERFGPHWKNIQKEYNKIFRKEEDRKRILTPKRIQNLNAFLSVDAKQLLLIETKYI